MKKLFLPFAAIFIFSFGAYSQSGQKFATGLNSLGGTDALGSSNNFPIIIKTNGTEKFRITETGNVGIGVIAPADKLHVAGTARMLNATVDNLMQALSVSAQNANFATAIITGQITGGSLAVSGNASISGILTTSNITSSSGTISFGNNTLSTTGNISSADIASSGVLQGQTLSVSGNATINGTLNAQTILQNGNPINQSQWTTSGSDIYYNGGNVGIGTSTPSEKLEVDGRIRISSSADSLPAPVLPPPPPLTYPVPRAPAVYTKNPGEESSIIIDGGVDQITATSGRIDFVTTNLVTLGKIGIGTQTPGFPLEVAGTIKVTGPVTNPPSAQQRSLIFDGGTDEITATSGTLTFPNTNLVTSGSITSANITTQQLTISGGMLESDTMHARKTFSVNNSLKLERQSSNNFAEVSTTDTSVALVLQRDTSGRGVGIGTTPSAGEKLSVAGDVGIINGNLRLSNLSGTGDRVLFVDQNGNLKLQPTLPLLCFGLDPFWKTDGNNIPTGCDPFIGTTNAADLIFKTDNQERMRITSTGAHPGNIGIGTIAPDKKLQVTTIHIGDCSLDPEDPTLDVIGTHEGIRLQNIVTDAISTQVCFDNQWDIQPYLGSGFAIRKPKPAPNLPEFVINGTGSVGIGIVTPLAKLHVNGTGRFSSNVLIGTPSSNGSAGKLQVVETAQNSPAIVAGDTTANSIWLVPNLGGGGYNFLSQSGDAGIIFRNQDHNTGNAGFVIAPHSSSDAGIRIAPDGKVGIGIPTPQARLDVNGTGYFSGKVSIGTKTLPNLSSPFLSNYELAVNGNIIAVEYVAKFANQWPDYVYEPDYNRMNYIEKELYFKKYKRMQGMDSAKEIEKGGLNLAKNLAGVTQNAEENSLDIIDLYKKDELQKEEIKMLKKEIEELKGELKQMKKK